MIRVADSAKKKIESLKSNQNITEEHFIRVSVVSGGCSGLSYQMDFATDEQDNDQVFEDQGIKIVTDLKSLLYLYDSTLQFSGGLNGRGFYFENPNASRTCGCGESFAV